MTDRQQTGLWFVITGVLLFGCWVFAYPIANWAADSGFIATNLAVFSDEQSYMAGASAVVALQLISLVGIPLVITGLAQIFIGAKAKKASRK